MTAQEREDVHERFETHAALAAIEHLKEFSDSVLEAFLTTGAGVEPITPDVARRLLWGEIRRTILGCADKDTLEPICQIRLAVPAGQDLEALKALEACRYWMWSVRTLGSRKAEDPTVLYITGVSRSEDLSLLQELRCAVEALRKVGEVRDYGVGLR